VAAAGENPCADGSAPVRRLARGACMGRNADKPEELALAGSVPSQRGAFRSSDERILNNLDIIVYGVSQDNPWFRPICGEYQLFRCPRCGSDRNNGEHRVP